MRKISLKNHFYKQKYLLLALIPVFLFLGSMYIPIYFFPHTPNDNLTNLLILNGIIQAQVEHPLQKQGQPCLSGANYHKIQTVMGSATGAQINYPMKIYVISKVDFSWEAEYDWIRICNYVSPEPTHGAWGVQEPRQGEAPFLPNLLFILHFMLTPSNPNPLIYMTDLTTIVTLGVAGLGFGAKREAEVNEEEVNLASWSTLTSRGSQCVYCSCEVTVGVNFCPLCGKAIDICSIRLLIFAALLIGAFFQEICLSSAPTVVFQATETTY